MTNSNLNLPSDANGRAVQVLKDGANQNLTSSGSSAVVTNPISAQVVRLATTTDVYYTFGTSPTADNTNPILTAGAIEYKTVPVPGVSKVAVLQVTTGGKVSVTEQL